MAARISASLLRQLPSQPGRGSCLLASLRSAPRVSYTDRIIADGLHSSHASSSSCLALRGSPFAVQVQVRDFRKFACPPKPNLDALRKVIMVRLTPVYFYLKNDPKFNPTVLWDAHFKGICCSPKFEGKSFKEINAMVEECAEEVGMGGRISMFCQPPSKWHLMRRRGRRRWTGDW
eukprot:TRINITY_DN20600_c0_g1_i1.p1 TRINITY_DN20600_c0_g1~~TRINITY_DN20600_c0_g1_i1.p1  ORF type:complete len:195 (-),score=30.28 TRINITY_DN20600_c0_g1_i1:282-809(-)